MNAADAGAVADEIEQPVTNAAAVSRPVRAGFILEQTLGHVTHSDNLQNLVPRDTRVDPRFVPIVYEVEGWRAKLPVFSNWTVRAGIRARRAIAGLQRTQRPEVVFIHTQVPAILVGRWLRKIPTVVSIDATPLQYDSFGLQYGHERSSDRSEKVKWWLNKRCFGKAAHVISWSEWSKQSLIHDYGVDGDRVTVLAPGVNVERWARPAELGPRSEAGTDGVMRILFVGGDLERKGGLLLLDAVRAIRESRAGTDRPTVELHLVTGADVATQDGVVVHRGLRPNMPELINLYHRADIFCLPTIGDCLPMVLSEAGAAGLPLVTTAVGAIHEIARDGETGLIVKVGDVQSLIVALERLTDDAALRRRLGENALELVDDKFDAAKNASALVDVLSRVARRRPAPRA